MFSSYPSLVWSKGASRLGRGFITQVGEILEKEYYLTTRKGTHTYNIVAIRVCACARKDRSYATIDPSAEVDGRGG
jgi:hypothetical protein